MKSEPTQDQALKDFKLAIQISPRHAKYYASQAELLFILEEDEEALSAADKALGLDPKCALACFIKGKALGRLKRPEEGLKSIDTAISLSPHDMMFVETRSRLEVVLGRWEDAERDLDAAIAGQNTLHSAYSDRIEVCYHLKKWAKVISDCTILLDRDASHHGHMFERRSAAYAALKQYAKAAKDLKLAVKLSPDDINLHLQLEALCKTMGDKHGAAEEGQKIKSLNGDFL